MIHLAPYIINKEDDEMNGIREKYGISGYTIKIIAIITMLIDHIGYMMSYLFYRDQEIRFIASIFRTIGRISFPLFCFLLVEGFIHTRDLKKYGLRLFLFALISEIPYDYAFSREINLHSQNVFFTLFIGLCVMAMIKKYYHNYIAVAVSVAAGCGLSIVLSTDYSWMGILIITLLYYFRDDDIKKGIFAGAMMIYASLSFGYGMAVIALIPILLYNGKKGKNYLKYVFYWFYPVHIAILYGISEYLRYLLYIKK